jgi:NDP-sugar pyrophosphorylase family protein
VKKAIILAAGRGTKIWPYGEVRPKALVPVAGKPLVSYLVNDLFSLGVEDIVIVSTSDYLGDFRTAMADMPAVRILETSNIGGTADTLSSVLDPGEETGVGVFYGDTIIHPEDLKSFLLADKNSKELRVLLTPQGQEDSRDWIGARLSGGDIVEILGHPREGIMHRFTAFRPGKGFSGYLERCPSHFPSLEVGMMPPREKHIESVIHFWHRDGLPIAVSETTHPTPDVDKPWHILEANGLMVERLCGELHENSLGEGSSIDDSASLAGPVRLGKNSRIGKNVILRGKLIAGDNVTIDAGAIIDGNLVVGDDSFIGNACFIEGGSVVGDGCVVSHAAELSGVIFNGVYLYHYMEIFGIVGENTDIGAATVCGSLRFDDGITIHKTRGRREFPRDFSNASYIGDYSRTGVNAVIMPGCKTGPYSIIGPAVLLEKDLAAGTGIRVKQEQETFPWGPERYGW